MLDNVKMGLLAKVAVRGVRTSAFTLDCAFRDVRVLKMHVLNAEATRGYT